MKKLLLLLLFCGPAFAGDYPASACGDGEGVTKSRCIQAQTRLMNAQAEALKTTDISTEQKLINLATYVVQLQDHVADLEGQVLILRLEINNLFDHVDGPWTKYAKPIPSK